MCAANDSLYVKRMVQVQDGTMRWYWIEDDLLYFKGDDCCTKSRWIEETLHKEAHEFSRAGHPGVERMLALLFHFIFLQNGRRYRGIR